MNTRTLAVVALLALCQAGSTAAQTQTLPVRIGIVASTDEDTMHPALAAFRSGLLELGQVEGRTFQLELRYAQGRMDRLPELVADVIGHGAEVLVVGSYPGILAAKQATSTIPIAGFSCGLELLVHSLARPGGNVTGVTCQSVELAAKQLQLLREALPAATRIAVLSNPSSPYSESSARDLRSVGSPLSARLIEIAVRSPADFEDAVAQMRRADTEAVFVSPDAMLFANRSQLIGLLLANRLPVMGFFRDFVDAGALLSYSANRLERYRRLAWYVDRILKGAKPADLPVEQPTKFELVINLKTAKALGLEIPQSLLARADEVIE